MIFGLAKVDIKRLLVRLCPKNLNPWNAIILNILAFRHLHEVVKWPRQKSKFSDAPGPATPSATTTTVPEVVVRATIKRKNGRQQAAVRLMVAGGGFEPPTFGL